MSIDSRFAFKPFPSFLIFSLSLMILLIGLAATKKPQLAGDWVEYVIMVQAISSHGTPDIRQKDADNVQRFLPDKSVLFQAMGQGIAAKNDAQNAGITRGNNSNLYAIHFFGYSALASVPFLTLEKLGIQPFRCFQFLNLSFVFILGLTLFRLYQSASRAYIGLFLFLLCGGLNYWNWSSPECMSAAALLSGLILFTTGAPIYGGLLAGLAAMQNPPIFLFFFAAPILFLTSEVSSGASFGSRLGKLFQPRLVTGLCLGILLFLVPFIFNYVVFGTPSIIGKLAADPALASLDRLHSFFFDLNQGMIIGIPGLLAGLGLLYWFSKGRIEGRRLWALKIVIAVFYSVAMAVPALVTTHWNSGATGMMRYAFWASMPFLFVFLTFLDKLPQWPRSLLIGVITVQGLVTYMAFSYTHIDNGPLANWVFKTHPDLYNPVPEIFIDRLLHSEDGADRQKAYVYSVDGITKKALFHKANFWIDSSLCGEGHELSSENRYANAGAQWRYINGPIKCITAGASPAPIILALDDFRDGKRIQFGSGWSSLEDGGSGWRGVWSDGKTSLLSIQQDPSRKLRKLSIYGQYFPENRRTRVLINGRDFGWQKIDEAPTLDLSSIGNDPGATLHIELRHDAPRAAGSIDTRQVALFLRTIELR
jgi:hypothetical protein